MASLGTRDRVIVEWAVMTGMWRMEIASLDRAALPRTAAVEFGFMPMVAVRLDVTKGGKPREVYWLRFGIGPVMCERSNPAPGLMTFMTISPTTSASVETTSK